MKALTAQEMREVDRLTTERYAISGRALMDAAGVAVADRALAWIRQWLPSRPARTAVLCGKGNNGGDGFVVADELRKAGAEIRVFLFGRRNELRGDALESLERWTSGGGAITEVLHENDCTQVLEAVRASDVLVDALLGTGLRGGATGLSARAIEQINSFSQRGRRARPGLILAVDTPSGLPSDGEKADGPVLFAHETVTFTAPKIGQLISPDSAAVGRLLVRQIGSPRQLIEEIGKSTIRWAEPCEFTDLPLVREADSNKGKYGHILVLAGAVGKSGAAELAGYAALRSGAGLVTVATAAPAQPVVASAFAEYMTEALTATASGTIARENLHNGRLARAMQGKTVLAVGPGLGQEPETQELIRSVVQETKLPLILDADALNAFADHCGALRERRSQFLAITPHPGEMARLLGSNVADVQNDRLKAASEAAARANAHVVLKGLHSIVADPGGKAFISTSGNPGMAKGGSGDVLTGVLAAVTGQFGTADWSRVLALGVELHGRAADLAVRGTEESGLLAHEIADAMARARHELLEESRRDV